MWRQTAALPPDISARPEHEGGYSSESKALCEEDWMWGPDTWALVQALDGLGGDVCALTLPQCPHS